MSIHFIAIVMVSYINIILILIKTIKFIHSVVVNNTSHRDIVKNIIKYKTFVLYYFISFTCDHVEELQICSLF